MNNKVDKIYTYFDLPSYRIEIYCELRFDKIDYEINYEEKIVKIYVTYRNFGNEKLHKIVLSFTVPQYIKRQEGQFKFSQLLYRNNEPTLSVNVAVEYEYYTQTK